MWSPPQYDEHQFSNRSSAVQATKTRDGWDTTGISFSDYGRMRTYTRKPVARRLPIPLWSQNDVELREVVLKFCEAYLYVRPPANATNEERLKAIAEKQRATVPAAQANLKRMLERYHLAANDPSTDAEELRRLGILVANFDKKVVILRDRNLASLLTSVLVQSYRLGRDSTTVAEELGVLPPMVRIWLYRCNRLAQGKTGSHGHFGTPTRPWPAEKVQRLFRLRVMGYTSAECAQALHCAASEVRRRLIQNFGDATVASVRERALQQKTRAGKWDVERLNHFLALRASGLSFNQCAKRLGTATSYAIKIWRKNFGDVRVP